MYPRRPVTRTEPEEGTSSPAISRSRADLPDPLTPMSAVRPGPTVKLSPSNRMPPSGQEK
jgi:hypothetical protein